jgi:hypothetical protein
MLFPSRPTTIDPFLALRALLPQDRSIPRLNPRIAITAGLHDPFNWREFLQTAAAAAMTVVGVVPSSAAGLSWNPGDLIHLIPMADHQRLLIKASLRAPLAEPPPRGPLVGDTWDRSA